ncbi:hypothetical protein LX36DRAFT_466324 [Colletotrichum falcatum]|nr:hypothetical protein LX36DRAFT_466324 [Colletotrichum falcatum]
MAAAGSEETSLLSRAVSARARLAAHEKTFVGRRCIALPPPPPPPLLLLLLLRTHLLSSGWNRPTDSTSGWRHGSNVGLGLVQVSKGMKKNLHLADMTDQGKWILPGRAPRLDDVIRASRRASAEPTSCHFWRCNAPCFSLSPVHWHADVLVVLP